MMEKIDKAAERAIEILNKCSTKNGFFASAGIHGYDAVWSRDSMITSLGASLIKNKTFQLTFKRSLITLAKGQSRNGQIPNAVDWFSKRKPHTDYKSIDSSLWYIIGHYIYKKRYRDSSLFHDYKKSIKKAFTWLSYQNVGENVMLDQLPTTDWQDAFPHKYGYTINTQALYYKVLQLMSKEDLANDLKYIVNKDKEDGLWNGDFYYPYRWKNHGKYKEIGTWFDSLGNCLSIVFELADEYHAEKILDHIKKKRINLPYPVKTIYPPITKTHENWQDYFKDCAAGKPYNYSNAGIWGYNGCFYVLSLIKLRQFRNAEKALNKLAEVNLRGNFPEWTHPKTLKTYGKWQGWEAGMYILAYKSLKNRGVLI